MAIVYQHRRLDNNEIFYIGIGLTMSRSKSKSFRNRYWHHIVEKYGYNIEITHKQISWEQACELEKFYIKKYGRKDLGLGNLVNMTDGGEGLTNVSDETRKKMSNSHKGKIISNETRKKLSKIKSGINNPFYNKKHNKDTKKLISIANTGRAQSDELKKRKSIKLKGRIFSNETKSKISEAKKGINHHFCKFEESDIISIRNEYFTQKISQHKLAEKYGVKRGTIYDILKRKTWKHV